MSIAWKVVKAASRVYAPWRRKIKQLDNLFQEDHFYSPLPRLEDVRADEARIFNRDNVLLPGIEIDAAGQRERMFQLAEFADEFPFPEHESAEHRFWLDNKFFPYLDAVLLYGMIRLVKPTRVVEVGSGFSSAACLDTNQQFFDNRIECTFIDPDPVRLKRLLTDEDRQTVRVVTDLVQNVPTETFAQLVENDILFIDSSHVAKIGSDVNHLFANVLPGLASGVYIHLHDVFYPFEYPKEVVYRGVTWNEAYMLRTFLQYNEQFQVVLWGDYLVHEHLDVVKAATPWHRKNSGSIWLQKR